MTFMTIIYVGEEDASCEYLYMDLCGSEGEIQ